MNDLKQEILKTLSFFDPMSLEDIFLDFDPIFLQEFPEFTYDDLLTTLALLESEQKLTLTLKDKQKFWLKIAPSNYSGSL